MAKPLTGQCSLGHRDIQAPLSCPGSGWPHCSQLGQTLPRPVESCSLSGHRRPGQPQRPELGVPLKWKATRPPQASFPTLCWPLPYILLLSKHLFHLCLERKEFLSFHCGATSDHRIPSPRVGRCTYPPTNALALPTTCGGARRAAFQPASPPPRPQRLTQARGPAPAHPSPVGDRDGGEEGHNQKPHHDTNDKLYLYSK